MIAERQRIRFRFERGPYDGMLAFDTPDVLSVVLPAAPDLIERAARLRTLPAIPREDGPGRYVLYTLRDDGRPVLDFRGYAAGATGPRVSRFPRCEGV